MKDILITIVSFLVVLIFIRITCRRKKLPPNAELICDIWKWAESPETPPKDGFVQKVNNRQPENEKSTYRKPISA